MKRRSKKRRRNPARHTNPSGLITTLICGAAAVTGITLVSVAMQSRRNAAISMCGRLGGLPEGA
jgi:hypothetical protein